MDWFIKLKYGITIHLIPKKVKQNVSLKSELQTSIHQYEFNPITVPAKVPQKTML
jgi:hypothetical protein